MLTDSVKFFVHAWLAALRSGNFSQSKHKLQDSNGYCCLGVACVVLKKIEPIKLDYSTYDENGRYQDGEILRGENLDSQDAARTFFEKLGLGGNGEPLLQEFDNNSVIIHCLLYTSDAADE